MLRTLARLFVLGPLLTMLSGPATVRGQAAPSSEMQGSSIQDVEGEAMWEDATAQAEHAQALRRARRRTRGWAAGLVLSIGLMAAGAPLIARGTQDSVCFSSPCPDQRDGAKLLASGMPMIMFGFGGVIGSALGLRAANQERRRLRRFDGGAVADRVSRPDGSISP